MLGYDISWAGFNIIEVMSSNKFTLKRIGYLSASQSFHCDSEVSILFEVKSSKERGILMCHFWATSSNVGNTVYSLIFSKNRDRVILDVARKWLTTEMRILI